MRKVTLGIAALLVAGGSVPITAQTARSISASDKRQGAEAHPQLLEQFGGAYRGPQARYVESVGKRIAVQSGLSNSQNDFTVTLLNSPVNNAFAIPGGYVYVTRQLVALMNDEAELASVLGHEIGHVAAQHSSKRNTRSTVANVLAGVLGAMAGDSAIGSLVGRGASYGAQLYTLKFSRTQEYEADDLGIRYLAGGGYDPLAASDMLGSLGAQSAIDLRDAGADAGSTPTWASTHPNTADRVARARSRAAQTGVRARDRNRDAFLNAIDGMLYGDDPEQGIIDGPTFRHPKLRIAFTAPTGYGMTNATDAVTIGGSGGQAQFSGGRLDGSLTDYVASQLRKIGGSSVNIDPGQIRTTRVNGLDAATVTLRASSGNTPVDATLFAYRVDTSAYHFLVITPSGRGVGPFSTMLNSFRRLSEAEAAAIKPRVIDVVTVRAGDTPATLANRMAFSDRKLERFLTLNGLAANARLTPGTKVKLVVFG